MWRSDGRLTHTHTNNNIIPYMTCNERFEQVTLVYELSSYGGPLAQLCAPGSFFKRPPARKFIILLYSIMQTMVCIL